MSPRHGHDDLLERLLETVERSAPPGESAEVYERRGASLEIVEDDDGTRVAVGVERGFALRLFREGRTAFAAGSPRAAERLHAEARRALSGARACRGVRAAGPLPSAGTPAPSPPSPAQPDETVARRLLSDFRKTLLGAGEGAVVLTEAALTVGERIERVATTRGRDVTFGSGLATLVAAVTGRTAAGSVSARVVASAARPEDLPLARLAHNALDRALLPLRGRPLEAVGGDLLLDSQVAAAVVGRLAPVFFGDEGTALLAARTRGGRDPFTSAALSLVDDANSPAGSVRTTHDAEGTPQSRTVLVSRGAVAGRLSDAAAASRLEMESTGNAQRRAYAVPPEIGVTNFFVDPSSGIAPLELLRALGRGFYAAVLLSRPLVDVTSDRLRLHVAGYRVEKGRAQDAVSETLVSGRLSEFLRSVASIGDDLRFVPSGSGAAGSPTLLVAGWKGA